MSEITDYYERGIEPKQYTPRTDKTMPIQPVDPRTTIYLATTGARISRDCELGNLVSDMADFD